MTLTLVDFLLARIAEDEELLDWGNPLRIHVDPGGNGDASFPFRDRWKAECKAKLQIVDLHGGDYDGECQSPAHLDGPCRTLRVLASIYSDHPDYRAEWAL